MRKSRTIIGGEEAFRKDHPSSQQALAGRPLLNPRPPRCVPRPPRPAAPGTTPRMRWIDRVKMTSRDTMESMGLQDAQDFLEHPWGGSCMRGDPVMNVLEAPLRANVSRPEERPSSIRIRRRGTACRMCLIRKILVLISAFYTRTTQVRLEPPAWYGTCRSNQAIEINHRKHHWRTHVSGND